ncbi:hypothetical protein L1049_026309 [Liquidambar formosana]|uniref:Uncharacterized protein n=1 Tax=Liquidambar formosana TaxID=63359 RepID=A0AAP0NEQ3_LIQFO
MEERCPPAGDGNRDHEPDPLPERTSRAGTYVVQVPKDQIYRVPPPEHALIAERRRNPLGISSIVLKPKDPKSYIEHVLVKTMHAFPHTLCRQNPNAKTGIFYNQGGNVSLSFGQQEIAVGKYPIFYQGHENSTFNTDLNVSNTVLPKEIERSMKSENSKVHISLSLLMNAPLKLKMGGVKSESRKIVVTCNLMLDTLAKDTHILSQECHICQRTIVQKIYIGGEIIPKANCKGDIGGVDHVREMVMIVVN